MKLTPEQEKEFLERAKREYPIGTQVYYMTETTGPVIKRKAIHKSDTLTVAKEPTSHLPGAENFYIQGNSGNAFIYIFGEWAKKVYVTTDNYLTFN